MVYSEQAQALVAYKVQSALGSQANGAGGLLLRSTGGTGAQVQKNAVESREIRQDAMSTRGRHGSQRTTGVYESELSLGNVDTILEALMRGTFGAADLVVDDATAAMSSATISVASNVITASAGSWITSGFRVGDVVRESEGLVAGSQNRNLRITALTATAMTVVAADGVALADEAGPIAAYTFTRPGRVLINPAAGSLVKRYFTVEEYDILLDQSEVFTDCVWSSMAFSMAPNGMFMANPSWTGTGQYEALESGSSPLFTSPAQTSGLPMAAIDASIRMGNGAVLDLTSFDMTINASPNAPEVIASNYAPDVFLGSVTIEMNLGMLRADLLDVADFIAETQLSLDIFIKEVSDAAPEDFISIHVPNFTFGSVDKSAMSKDGGPRTQTIAIPPALVGKDERGGAYDPTMIKFQVSNAT